MNASSSIWAGIEYTDCLATRADEKRLARELAFFLAATRRTVGGGSDALPCPACGQTVDGSTCWSDRCPEGWDNINAVLGGDEYREWGDAVEAAYLLAHEL